MTEAFTMQEQNIVVGGAAVVAHEDGGWALPGGAVTQEPLEALEAANRIARYIDAHGGRERALRAPQFIRRA